jgi:hypothetical protein
MFIYKILNSIPLINIFLAPKIKSQKFKENLLFIIKKKNF